MIVSLSVILLIITVYKTKTFNRWAIGAGLDDKSLREAAAEVAEGTVEADLGGGIYKKRVALPGKGKRGGTRTLVAFKEGAHTFYLHGFKKKERSNISTKEVRVLKQTAAVWFSMSPKELQKAVKARVLVELEKED